MARLGDWEADFITGANIWSDESFRILGMEPGEVEPSQGLFMSFVHPEDIAEVGKTMQESSESLKGFSINCRIIRRDGAVRYIHSDCRFIRNAEGRPVKLRGFMQDVTETRLLEQSLVETNKDLETFIYKASHDLRGPLVSIIGLTDACKEELHEGPGKKYMDMIGLAIRKLDYTLTSLVQSMSIKKTQLLNDTIDFDTLIPEVLSQLVHYDGYATMDVRINVEVSRTINSSKFILQSILQNLFENAVKYRNKNAPRPELNISVREHFGEVVICCQDNGMGIDKALHEKVFEMYFRGTDVASGSGLGLYLVKNGIDRLGGRIVVESEPGKGSKFFVHIPLLDQPIEFLKTA
jgi:PAS domain S-box-containing protein